MVFYLGPRQREDDDDDGIFDKKATSGERGHCKCLLGQALGFGDDRRCATCVVYILRVFLYSHTGFTFEIQ